MARACRRRATALTLVLALASAAPVLAATYYVDFEKGSDANPGTAQEQAFKHCPGDGEATDTARSTELAPGDTVIFRGGVLYRSTIEVRWSGQEGRPITYDGNTASTFGNGRAVIDGSEPLAGWTRCRSAEECGGNPNWQSIYHTSVPSGANPFNINLSQGDRMLSVAQDPDLKDTFFDDDLETFRPVAPPIPMAETLAETVAGEGMLENSSRPYMLILDGKAGTSAILDPCVGASLTFRFHEPVTVTAFGLEASTNYTMPKDFTLLADGKELLAGQLANERGPQRFDLPQPATFQELTLRVLSIHPDGPGYGALAEIQGYDANGRNVLLSPPIMRYSDHDCFTQEEPDYWDGAYFVLYARPAAIYKLKVLRFEPETDTVFFEMLAARQYATGGKFSMMNALRILDRPGEFVLDETPRQDGTHRLYLWPLHGEDGLQEVAYSARQIGFSIRGASHVTLQGLKIQKQGGTSPAAIASRGQASNIVIRDNEITMLRAGPGRSGAIGMSDVSHSLIDGNRIHLNAHCAGLMLSRFNDSVASNNILHKNGSTAVDYYGCHRSKLLYNTLTEHKGVHANGLTMYLGCSDILVEGNKVFSGNVGLTAQDGTNITIRNNIFDGHGKAMSLGLWGGRALENLRILNNLCLRSNKDVGWTTGIFNGNRRGSGYVIRNNVIDGLYGEPAFPADTVFSHNIYTRIGPWQKDRPLGEGETYEPDLKKIFVDPDNHDYRLRAGSPAIDAGTDVGIEADITGTPVPQGEAPDIGPHEYVAR